MNEELKKKDISELKMHNVPEVQQGYKSENVFLNIQEASDLTKLPKETLYLMACRMKIPHVKIGARVFFYSNALTEWMRIGENSI